MERKTIHLLKGILQKSDLRCRCSGSPASKFVCASQEQMVIQVKTRDFILVRVECPYVHFELSQLGVQTGERGSEGPKSLGCVCVCTSAGVNVRISCKGYASPFYSPRGEDLQREREDVWGSGDSRPRPNSTVGPVDLS